MLVVVPPAINAGDPILNSYFKVANLDEGDHLNVRAEPSAAATDIGDIESGSQPWEILELDSTGEWGKILWHERSGWIALRYMEQIQVEFIEPTKIPVGLTCLGSEPFWTIEFKSPQSILMSTQEGTQAMSIVSARRSENSGQFPAAVNFRNDSSSTFTVIRREECSDGMSESPHTWSVDVIIQPRFKLLSGCCVVR